MTLALYELGGLDDRRYSLFSWRTRLALAHKGLTPEYRPVRISDKAAIAFSKQDKVPILIDGVPAEANVKYCANGPAVAVDGVTAALDATAIEAADAIYVLRQGRQTVVRRADLGAGDLDHADGDGQIKAPMHGKVLALLVSNGERVEKGQRLVIVEAMKMEHALTAPHGGRVAGIVVAAGSQVAEGAKLMTIESMDK